MIATGTIIISGVIDGRSIVSANVWYAISNIPKNTNGQEPADSAFTYDDFPNGNLTPGMYVWQATIITFSDGQPEVTGKMYLGATTDFLQGVEVYAVNQDSTMVPETWATSYTRQKGYYLWTATKVTYTNGHVDYLNPKCVGYWGEDAPYDVVTYARYDSRAANAITGAPTGTIDDILGWQSVAPAPNPPYRYIWERIEHYGWEELTATRMRTSYVCLTGPDGITGPRGKAGRFYYYDQDYDGTKEYKIEQTQAPYVRYNGGFWMLDNGGTEPDSLPHSVTGVAPTGAAGNPWTQMSSEQQYYIARAFFGQNAYLGSFIINGDWMLSQYGTLIDVSGTKTIVDATNVNRQYNGKVPYAWFDPTDPTASSNPQQGSYKFTPNFAVDGLTGATYQNKAYVRGEVHATSGEFSGTVYAAGGEFNGVVKASLVYQSTFGVTNNSPSNPYYIDPQNEPYSTFIQSVGEYDYGAFAVLPDADLYDGLELKFFYTPLITRTGDPNIHLKSDSFRSGLLKGISYVEETISGGIFRASDYIQPEPGMIVLKSISGHWWVVQGKASPSNFTNW